MKKALKNISVILSFLVLVTFASRAQQSKQQVMTRLFVLRNDFTGRITEMCFKPSLPSPRIILNNPPSFGNYDDDTNTLQSCDWNTLPPQVHDLFQGFAQGMKKGMTGEKFFELGVYQWIFIHELSHWWRACQHVTADPYENEKAANRIASAYWHEKDLAFYNFMVIFFKNVIASTPTPIPTGQSKEKYLKSHYPNFPTVAGYTWYQATMIVEVSREKPLPTFKKAIEYAGKP